MYDFSQFWLFAKDTVSLGGLTNTINHRPWPRLEWHSFSREKSDDAPELIPQRCSTAAPLISSKAVRFRAWHYTAWTRKAFFQPENTCLLPRKDYLKMCELATHCRSLPSKARRGFAVIRGLFSEPLPAPQILTASLHRQLSKKHFIYRMPLAWRTSCSIFSGASSIVIVVWPWAYWRGLKVVFFSFSVECGTEGCAKDFQNEFGTSSLYRDCSVLQSQTAVTTLYF